MVTPRIDGEKGIVTEVDVPEEDAPEVAVQKKNCTRSNLFIYQGRESTLVPAGFLSAHFWQKT